MKLVFLSSILNLPANVLFRLLLYLAVFLPNAQDFAGDDPVANTKLIITGENAKATTFLTCTITGITTSNISGCMNRGTNDIPEDDYFTADVTVTYFDKPASGKLILTGRGIAEAAVYSIGNTSCTFYSVEMRTAAELSQPIYLKAYFSAEPACTFTNTNAGTAPVYCSTEVPPLCPSDGAHNGGYPACWPPEGDNLPSCENSIKYAPDPIHPELTPVKYIRAVVHILQKEDPNDRDNFTEEHINVIKSWFDGPEGINHFLANLCPTSDDYSPDIPDARIRIINEGIPGFDVFFHPDNDGWGTSLRPVYSCPCGDCCNQCNNCNPCCVDCGTLRGTSLETLTNRYVTGTNGWAPSLTTDEINALSSTEIRNAYHFFISRGRWRDCNKNGSPDPFGPVGDSYDYWTTGWTTDASLNCQGNPATSPPTTPVAIFSGAYETYLRMTVPGFVSPVYSQLPTSVSAMGRGFFGELYHIMGVDHIGPLRTHRRHVNGDDGCEDTPWAAVSNVLGCQFEGDPNVVKCALTQCQLGKIHYFFERLNPAIQRFPEGPGPHVPVGGSSYNRVGNCEINMPDIVIENGQVEDWDWFRSLRSNVVVQTGGRLFIRCRVGMPEGATITVEPGGRLYLYGEVYNNCDGQRWQGVVVKGNSGLPQSLPPSANQGFFRIINGIIEGANTSIRVESGGMVVADGANIRNSGGMLFEPYSFPQKGWFTGCNFTCDGNIFDFGANTYKHAELYAVNNVRFTGCNFNVVNVPTGQLSQTAGIRASGSMFRVYSSTFRGFDTGIDANGQFSSFNSFTANNCTFSNNQTGIFAFSMQNFTMTKNKFEVGGADFQSNSPCGLMMDNCTGYTVEENTFYGQNNIATGRYGIMTEDSGDDANLISGNNFDYLEYANIAQGDNRGVLQGLQYHCNTNGGHNPRDFYVPGGFKQQGIHINQGNGKAAMNTFSHFGAFTDGDFWNEVGVIIYNHKIDPAHEPNPNTPPGTGGINKIQAQSDNVCPSDVPPCDFPCEFTAAEWQQTESEFNTAKTNWQTEKASFLSLMDSGDTGGLVAQINGATSLNAGQVVQNLLNRSPWLSTQALTTTINKKQVLTENSVVQILNANPDGLREQEVRALVKSSFSHSVADGILANAGSQTVRTTKEILVGQYRAAMLRNADLLIQDILKDTTQVDVPLLRTWQANKQSLEADYAIVASYLSEGYFTAALQKLDAIPQTHALDAEGVTEHGYFADLSDLWQDAHANGKTMAELDQAGVSAVRYIADNSNRRAGAMAQGILNTWYGGHYRVVPILPGGQGPQGLMMPPTGNSAAPATSCLSVFPNPAKGSVQFHWNLPDGMENAVISITDLQGKLLEVIEVAGQKGKQEWSVERLGHGIYIFHVKLPDGNSQTSKLAIIK